MGTTQLALPDSMGIGAISRGRRFRTLLPRGTGLARFCAANGLADERGWFQRAAAAWREAK